MSLISGVFGKMPAHGDFVRRGWDDVTIDALDAWCGDAVRGLREHDHAENSGPGAQIVRLWVPPGALGNAALHIAAAPSRDRVGRAFMLVAGVAGEAAWGHAQAAGERLTDALRPALAGDRDADATLAAVAATLDGARAIDDAPTTVRWWCGAREGSAARVDADLLAALLREPATA